MKTWRLIYPGGTESVMNYDPILEERKQTTKDICELIKNKIKDYKEGKLKNSNFTAEDRAVAMVVLEVLISKIKRRKVGVKGK